MLYWKHSISAAYHPQTNGLVERLNQTLVNMLTKLSGEKRDDWDDYIDVACFQLLMRQLRPMVRPKRLTYNQNVLGNISTTLL